MRNLHIIMPMAGEGSRFLKQGVETPKPLIQAKGIPFFLRAINSIHEIDVPRKYSFIVRKEHIDHFGIDKTLLHHFSDARIIPVEKTTRGAVETCLLAKRYIHKDDAILVLDCDLEFKSHQFNALVKENLSQPVNKINGGILVSFPSDLPQYSYASTTDDGTVTKTAEKEVISENALAGAYFFSKAQSFLYAAEQLLKTEINDKPEFYISLLYNTLITNGESVKLSKTDYYNSFGTPEELKGYLTS